MADESVNASTNVTAIGFVGIVEQIEAGKLANEFTWGQGLGPRAGEWRAMTGKLGGCLLHKAEAIALHWDFRANSTRAVDVPQQFYHGLCTGLAACCASTSRRSWCLERAGPTYNLLAEIANGGESNNEVFATAFGGLVAAAKEVLSQTQEGHSERAALLLSTCPSGSGACSADQLERLEHHLHT